MGDGEKSRALSKCGNGGFLFHCLACRFDGMLLNHYQQSIFATPTSTARIDDNDWKWLEGTGRKPCMVYIFRGCRSDLCLFTVRSIQSVSAGETLLVAEKGCET